MKIYDFDIPNKDYEHIENNPYLGEVDAKPDIYEIFKLNGKWYVLSLVAANREYGAVHEIKHPNFKIGRTVSDSDIICPVCGYRDNDSWEEDDENDNYSCGQCGAVLEVERYVDVTYSATVKELPTVLGELE